MKVSPPYNLIVCAILPQTIVRHFVLAAAAYVSVLCGAASAQSAPAAPPLLSGGAVELSYEVGSQTTVTLETSANLTLWQPVVAADYDAEVSHYVPVSGPKGYFRLRQETRPAVGKSRWELSGARLVKNTVSGMEILSFTEGGSGSRETLTGTGTFVWEWQRTGRDTGSAVITWPDGIVETMDLQFTAANSGAFTSERAREGVPVGAVTGTFRDDPAALLVPSMPAQPANKSITLSGTGRPQRIDLDTAGNAAISSPAGTNSFTAAYETTGAASAELVLTCQDGTVETCDLVFTGPACGTYTLKVEAAGTLRRSATGTFTVAPR